MPDAIRLPEELHDARSDWNRRNAARYRLDESADCVRLTVFLVLMTTAGQKRYHVLPQILQRKQDSAYVYDSITSKTNISHACCSYCELQEFEYVICQPQNETE